MMLIETVEQAAAAAAARLQWATLAVSFIAAIGVVAVNVINAMRQGAKTDAITKTVDQVVAKVDVVAEKAQTIEHKADVIKDLSNGHTQKLEDRLTSQETTIKNLEKLITKLASVEHANGVAEAKAVGLAGPSDTAGPDRPVADADEGLSPQEKKDVKVEADTAIKDAGLIKPPRAPRAAKPLVPPTEPPTG